MRGATMIGQTTLVVEECCTCGLMFAMTSDFKTWRQKKHDSFYCPAGHPQFYVGKTDEQKLREELAAAERNRSYWRDRAESADRSRVALRGVVTRTKNRIAKGLCPCCSRRFADLASHMDSEHPEYVDS